MDKFFKLIAAQIFEKFPEWKSEAVAHKDLDGSYFLRLRIAPPPQSKSNHPLQIDTSSREVTIGFDHYHSHYNSFVNDHEISFGMDSAQDFVEQILNEEVVIVSFWASDKWRGSIRSTPEDNFAENDLAKSSDMIKVRSWRGTYSRDIAIT